MRTFFLACCATAALSLAIVTAPAAELATGSLLGTVRAAGGSPIAGARVVARAPSARYATTTDSSGSFTLLGLLPDTYAISVDAAGYQPANETIVVLPSARNAIAIVLQPVPREIAHVRVTGQPFSVGSTTDVFTVQGAAARASTLQSSASGLSAYSQETIAGAIANVPGVQQDSFANVIVRGGKIQDTAYEYDSVPVPQGLIAEPGGNLVGAQLGSTGVSAETVALGGYSDVGQNALGGVVNGIPLAGTYPAKTTLEVGTGIGAYFAEALFSEQAATPDLQWRYAFSASSSNAYFPYGDGHTFYPAEIGTYGLGFQTRAAYEIAANVHYAASPLDDVSAEFLTGAAAYQQYGSPYQGLQWSTFSSPGVPFPGSPANPNQQVDTPSIARGTYGVAKLQWIHDWSHSLGRLQLFQSQIGAIADGPEWDDLSFSDGVISLYSTQYQKEDGIGYDYEDQGGTKHEIKAGAQYDVDVAGLDQVVPTVPQFISSSPLLRQYLAYAGDTWSIDDRLTAMGSLRYIAQRSQTGDGLIYGDAALDPHASLAYLFAKRNALRLTFDHTSVPPLPLEVQRTCFPASACSNDSGGNANGTTPSYPLAPETADDYALSYEAGGPVQLKLTYFAEFEKNRIDVLPSNFRDAASAGENPNAVGVPTNAGELRSHGLELWSRYGGFTLSANYNSTYTSSVYQFAFNDLNVAAILAGHLYPANYVPNFTATGAYEFDFAHRRIRVTPALSYEGGYPYGNGTHVWTIVDGRPEDVPNDNFINPGYNYYFLKNPAQPWNPQTNPYIATLGTNEGADPNTLRTMPQMLASLHVEGDLSPRVTAILDVGNLFGTATPTQLQGNPYLIGPPGYAGGNPLYEAAYGKNYCSKCLYTLPNGVPTNDGTTAAVPWSYGRGGYVPEAYPMARTAQFRLRYRL